MSKLKVKIVLIIALALALVCAMGAYLGLNVRADRYVTLSGSSIFNTSGRASVWAHKEASSEEGDEYYYTSFAFSDDDDGVNYRRNLAYKWYYNKNDEPEFTGGDESGEGEEEETPAVPQAELGYLNLEIGFEALNFKKFTVTFETQQYGQTEADKTVNRVIFIPVPVTEGGVSQVYAIILPDENSQDAEKSAEDLLARYTSLTPLEPDHIKIALSENEELAGGEFIAKVSSGAAEQVGKFTNVGESYAKYVSSSSKPVIPLAFAATFGEDESAATSADRVRMAIYELNGQSFALNRNEKGESAEKPSSPIVEETEGEFTYYTGGQVNDVTPPVLCLDKGVTFIGEGSEISFGYTAIDVLTQSPSTETGYFMLTKEQFEEGVNADNVEDGALFKKVTDSDDELMLPHVNHYKPQAGDFNSSVFGEDRSFVPTAAVKIYLKLTDTSSTGGQSTYVLLDWFVDDEYKLTIGKDAESKHDYIAVATDKAGASYNYGADWENIIEEYQNRVNEASAKLLAGKDSFYLPSAETLFSDNATAYEDMTYSIYYLSDSGWSQSTNLSPAKLSIKPANPGDFIFTVYAHDGASNKMWYMDGDEKKEFGADEIEAMFKDEKDEGLKDRLPWFTFTAGLAEISVKDPGEQDVAYYGTSYTADSFEVDGVSTTTDYSLYRFENELYYKDNAEYATYQDLLDNKQTLFAEYKYFTEIPASATLEDDTEEYELYNAYEWNPTNRSFVPQEENGFYLIVCRVSDNNSDRTESGYMVVASSSTPPSIVGEDTWLEDNLTSIILLSIAGAALVGIVLLLVIKPKQKGDIDEVFEKETSDKKRGA